MSKPRVESFTVLLDGFGAGPGQDISNPLGVGGMALQGWAIPTRSFQNSVCGNGGGEAGVDEDFAARGFHNAGRGFWAATYQQGAFFSAHGPDAD